MRYQTRIFTVWVAFFCSSLFGAGPSEWDSYCRRCHVDRPVNALYDSSIKPHKNTPLSCVGCHRDKGIAGHVRKSAQRLLLLFEDMTLPADIRPQPITSASSAECLACHFYIWEVDEIDKRKLPKNVRSIALRASHSQHWDYRTFTPEQQSKLKNLLARKAKSPLSKIEQDQLERLSQIEKMQCSRCHERFRKAIPGGVDPNVNIAMKNPIECTACHVALRATVHPGDNSPLPSAVSCERCHYGKLHQKMTFFPVDYTTEADCLRCHPRYLAEELRVVKAGQFSHKSTSFMLSSKK